MEFIYSLFATTSIVNVESNNKLNDDLIIKKTSNWEFVQNNFEHTMGTIILTQCYKYKMLKELSVKKRFNKNLTCKLLKDLISHKSFLINLIHICKTKFLNYLLIKEFINLCELTKCEEYENNMIRYELECLIKLEEGRFEKELIESEQEKYLQSSRNITRKLSKRCNNCGRFFVYNYLYEHQVICSKNNYSKCKNCNCHVKNINLHKHKYHCPKIMQINKNKFIVKSNLKVVKLI
jgi:hypothetical protein